MAQCPNINTQEWKDLVKEVGEIKAYYLFINNGYEIPSSLEDIDHLDVIKSEEEEVAYKLQEATEIRSQILGALKTKVNIFEGSKNADYITDLKELIKKFEHADIGKSLLLFLHNAEKNIDSLLKRIEKEKDNLELLKLMDNFAGTYENIDLIKNYMATNYNYEAIDDKISRIEKKVDKFHSKYVDYSKKTIINRLAAESTIIRNKYRDEFAREFQRNYPKEQSGLSFKEYDIKKTKYINEKLGENSKKIIQEERSYIRQLLNTSPSDVSGIAKNLVDPRGINDHLIQLAVKLIDKADFKVKEQFIQDKLSAYQKFEEFAKNNKDIITDQKKLYEDMIEIRDGNYTNYYVRPLYSEFYEAKNQMFVDRANEEDSKKSRDIVNTFKKKYLINPNGKWEDINNIKPEYKNPQWNKLQSDSRKKSAYDFLINFNTESDKMVKAKHKLGYRLPGITKKGSERFTDNGLKSYISEGISDTFNMKPDDYKYGDLVKEKGMFKVATDEKGRPLNRISVPFRISPESKDQSFDLFGMAISNRFVSLNYKEKSNIRTELEVLKDLFAERKVKRTRGLGDTRLVKSIRSIAGVSEEEHQELVKEGLESNSYKLLESILEDRLYGRSQIDGGEIFGMSVDKMTDFVIGASANNLLIANYMGGGANILAGKVMNFLEGTRKKHYDRSNLRAAEKRYGSDLHRVLNDIGSFVPESKTNLMLEKFVDTSMDFSGFSNDLIQDNKVKRMLGIKTLHGFNNVAEHYIHSTLMYAILNNIKVTNKDGKFINKDGKVVERDNAMSVDEAYTSDNGKLKWANQDWVPEGFSEYSEDFEFMISRKIKDVTADLQGNYDANNKAMVQRYWYGKLGFFLRKWIVRGTMRRWRGIESATKDLEDLDIHQRFYSESNQEIKEGTYVSALRFLSKLKRHGKFLEFETYTKNWNQLSDMERSNIRSAVAEFSIMVTCLGAATMLASLAEGADDDEEEFIYSMAYLLRRQYGEILFYTPLNPAEVTRILSTPTATISVIKQTQELGDQLLNDAFGLEFERYQRGDHKGEAKSWVRFMKFINPFYKQFGDRDAKESFEYLTNARY